MPIVRTFAPVVAGMGRMDYRRFLFFNVFGGALWVALDDADRATYLGQIPGVREHIEIVIVVVVFLSILPGLDRAWLASGRNRRRSAPPGRPAGRETELGAAS